MIVCYIMYRRDRNLPRRYPHFFTRVGITGNIFDGWTAPGNGLESHHVFIPLDYIESIEFWETTYPTSQPDGNKKEGEY